MHFTFTSCRRVAIMASALTISRPHSLCASLLEHTNTHTVVHVTHTGACNTKQHATSIGCKLQPSCNFECCKLQSAIDPTSS